MHNSRFADGVSYQIKKASRDSGGRGGGRGGKGRGQGRGSGSDDKELAVVLMTARC